MFFHQDREQNTKKIKLPVMYFIVKPGAKSRPPGGKKNPGSRLMKSLSTRVALGYEPFSEPLTCHIHVAHLNENV